MAVERLTSEAYDMGTGNDDTSALFELYRARRVHRSPGASNLAEPIDILLPAADQDSSVRQRIEVATFQWGVFTGRRPTRP
jgi:hypothetical protein